MIDFSKTATARAPAGVSNLIKKFRHAIETFSRHSKGEVEAKDIMYGTFLRVDKSQNQGHTGRINKESFMKVLRILKLSFTDKETDDMMIWFDSNGSSSMDYNEFTRQLYGTDILLRPLALPPLSLMLTKSGKDFLETSGLHKAPRVMCPHGKQKSECEICLADKVFKSRAKKLLEKEARKKLIATEKSFLVNKLKSIEQQRALILEQQHVKSLNKQGA